MSGRQFTVKYGRDGSTHNLSCTHSFHKTLETARVQRDEFYNGGGNGGWPQETLRVWVEDGKGNVVYGVATKRPQR